MTPIHDWTRIDAGMFHGFHVLWLSRVVAGLNAGVLPPGYFAVPEQGTAGYVTDVLTLRARAAPLRPAGPAQPAPAAALTAVAEPARRRRPRRHVAVKHVSQDQTVAVVELVSPGNKDNRDDFREFVGKAVDLIEKGVHLLVIDLFPPTRRDPHGLHAAVWKALTRKRSEPPADKPLTFASYRATAPAAAFVHPRAVGDPMPDLPLFLSPQVHVTVPLAATYATAWGEFPAEWRTRVGG